MTPSVNHPARSRFMRVCLRPSPKAITFLVLTCLVLLAGTRSSAEEKKPAAKGLRVFTCGHSFHVFVPGNLADVAKGAGIKDHKMAGLSSIGGSRVIQHWNVEEKKNKAKE